MWQVHYYYLHRYTQCLGYSLALYCSSPTWGSLERERSALFARSAWTDCNTMSALMKEIKDFVIFHNFYYTIDGGSEICAFDCMHMFSQVYAVGDG